MFWWFSRLQCCGFILTECYAHYIETIFTTPQIWRKRGNRDRRVELALMREFVCKYLIICHFVVLLHILGSMLSVMFKWALVSYKCASNVCLHSQTIPKCCRQTFFDIRLTLKPKTFIPSIQLMCFELENHVLFSAQFAIMWSA